LEKKREKRTVLTRYMALRFRKIMSVAALIKYHEEQLRRGTSEYYLKEHGLWYGKLVERLGLSQEIDREAFIAIMSNQYPENGERVTQRTKTIRKETVWEWDAKQETSVKVEQEVSNHRVGTDMTLSLKKDQSVYLAASKDKVFEQIVHRVMVERLKAIEAKVQTRIRKGGVQEDRTTGEALFGVFIHRTTRPVNGIPDCHWHAHAICANMTWDPVEQRMKAAQLGDLYADKAYQEAVFHARLDEELTKERYGFRRTADGLELTVVTHKEARIFCKRTELIEKEEEKQRNELQRKTAAIVAAEARAGRILDPKAVYKSLKDKLGEQSRNKKETAIVDGKALEAEWAKQLGEGRWQAITPQAARNGDRINFLSADVAKTLAIQHAFEKEPVIRDVELFQAIALFGCGTMTVREMETFCQTDPRLVRNPQRRGMVTTWECVAEEQKIRELVAAGKSIREPIGAGIHTPKDKDLDEGQLKALQLILETRAMAIAIPGRPGAGKSRLDSGSRACRPDAYRSGRIRSRSNGTAGYSAG
jgi:conjugative relaxase-like TrwC/TraI family protein